MKKILLVLFLLASFVNVKASHLMGGEITWKCIKSGPNAGFYVFQVKVFRDCQGIAISTNMSLDVHNVPGMNTIPLSWISGTDISPTCNTIDGQNPQFTCNGLNNAMAGSGNGAVEEHLYISDTIRILGTPDANGWHFTWSSCCRNSAITNGLANAGFTLRAVMYSYTDSIGTIFPNNNNCYNSSPTFYEKPRTILEVGNGYDPLAFSNGFTYSHNAFDDEQDSLSYSWGMPIDGYNSTYDYLNPNSIALSFVAPYSYTNPINGIVMNNQTGRTYYPANQQGNYVTCTNVSAYRCGQLVSEVFREVQVVLIAPTCNLGDTTSGNIGADTLCNVRPQVQPPFFYPATAAPFRWDTMVHCGDTVRFNFEANDYDYYPNGSRQDLKFEVSGGQFMDYNVSPPAFCQNPPCATFEELGTGTLPPFITSGGTGTGYFEWFTSCNHVISTCSGDLRPSLYTFVLKVQDDFCPAPAIENQATVISIYVLPPCSSMKINPSSTAASCGTADGTISIAPTSGFPPYTAYYFDMNGIPVNPNAVFSGNYQVRVVDSSQCESVDTVTVFGPPGFSFSATTVNPTCNGGNNGSATVNITTGVPPFTYLWSNGTTTPTINNLSSGSYYVTVTDSNGCISSDTVLLSQPNAMQSNTSTTNVSCYGGADGTAIASITANGLAPFSYIWSNGATTQLVSNLSAATYLVVITDSSGCSVTDSVVITQPMQLIVDSSTTILTNITCYSSNDGSIDITPSGGTPSYTFVWSNGTTSEDLVNVGAGTYSVTVSDNNMCSSVSYTYIITQPTQITNTNVATSVSCNGNADGSIDITTTGGITSYTYLWSNGATTEDISNLTTGVYSVIITDYNGCTYFDTIIMVEPAPLQPSLSVSGNTLTGIASGGTPPYSYEFWGPTGLVASSFNNMGTAFTINPLVSGTYTFIVIDNNGCTDSADIVFTITTSIFDLSESGFKLYPNPTSGDISIDFLSSQKEVKLIITDVLGKNMYLNKVYKNTQKEHITFSHLSKGYYVILLELGGKRYSEVVIYR